MLVHAGIDINAMSAYGTAMDVTQSPEIKAILIKSKDKVDTPGKVRKQISVPGISLLLYFLP